MLAVHEREHEALSMMDNWRGKGMTWAQVAKALGQLGRRQRSGKLWTRQAVHRAFTKWEAMNEQSDRS